MSTRRLLGRAMQDFLTLWSGESSAAAFLVASDVVQFPSKRRERDLWLCFAFLFVVSHLRMVHLLALE